MLTINVICVGKLKEKYLKDAIAEYSKRLSKYCKLNIIEVKDEIIPDTLNEKLTSTFSLFCSTLGTGGGS